jgi:hypothetical protein
MEDVARRALEKRLAGTFEGKLLKVVSSADQLADATTGEPTIAFLDATTLPHVASHPPTVVVAVSTDDSRKTPISWMQTYPWLAHVLSASLLETDVATDHLVNLIKTFRSPEPRLLDWMDSAAKGRRTRITHSGRRGERVERMSEFLQANGCEERAVIALRDVADELLTNAFYDAPVVAGAFKHPIARTVDVLLPSDRACDIAYGCNDALGVVRVRDPFGSLSRRRLIEVLASGEPHGLSRVLGAATVVGISVVSGRHTEILVGVANKREAAARPFGVHLFFKDSERARTWRFVDEDLSQASLNKSVTIMAK